MSEGLWVVLGATIGTAGSLMTTWLNAYFARESKFPKYDKAVGRLLVAMLTGGDQWCDIEKLMHVTGLPEKEIKEYLIELGARGSEKNGKLWGLISRNPLPIRGDSN